jgi:hypothetical protein
MIRDVMGMCDAAYDARTSITRSLEIPLKIAKFAQD